MKISAIVLSYDRVPNLGAILRNLVDLEWVDEVLLWHQGPRLHDRQIPELLGICDSSASVKVRVFHSANRQRLGRFEAMDFCENDSVLVQDDDVLPLNLAELRDAWEQDQGSIVALLDRGHLHTDDRRHWGDCHEVLLGWGAIIDRRWRRPAFDAWLARWGNDDLLQSKADRVFSIMQKRRHRILAADYRKLPGADGPNAVWTQPDHDARMIEARGRCLNKLLGLGIPEAKYRRR